MTDIVERLRTKASDFDGPRKHMASAMREAADEIERLRNLAPIVREQGFELERLRANELAAIFAFRETNDMALEEIKRLRAALQQIADDATPNDDNYCSEIARRALEPKP